MQRASDQRFSKKQKNRKSLFSKTIVHNRKFGSFLALFWQGYLSLLVFQRISCFPGFLLPDSSGKQKGGANRAGGVSA